MSSRATNIEVANTVRVIRHRLLCAAVACVALSATTAWSGELEPAQVSVKYSQPELARASEARELYARLRMASRAVCNGMVGNDLRTKRLRNDCVNSALAAAVADVDHTAITALHNQNAAVRLAQGRSSAAPRT